MSMRHNEIKSRLWIAAKSYLVPVWIALATIVCAQTIREVPQGIAWQVKGKWRVDGQTNPLRTGDTIAPGSLLWPMPKSPVHSITVLLPDGQRILYECYLPEDCSRGFRVPQLYQKPDPFAADMLWRIHSVLAKKGAEAETQHDQMPLPRDESVATLDAQGHLKVTGLVAALPDGHYTYTEHALDHDREPATSKGFDKKGSFITLDIPSAGLYDVVIADGRNTPRVDLMIAAVNAAKGADATRSFRTAKGILKDWNDDYQGWPIHDFQRAYLEALMMGIEPSIPHPLPVAASQEGRAGVVREPVFTPRPGVLHGDTAVSLSCDTPGATIHFTVDGSQPLSSSAVYGAPIIVKGTALTIKAFATAAGKKQSAVVTGIFRIGEQ